MMTRPKMHEDEVESDAGLVRCLLAHQFPHWANLPIEAVASHGTDHHIYRLGEQLAVRLPCIGWATGQAEIEAEWLPRLAPHLPLAVPTPRGMGGPGEGYPYTWSVVEWLPGHSAHAAPWDADLVVTQLAEFVLALRRVETTGAHPRPTGARGAPLQELDARVRRAVAQLGDRIDGAAATRSWQTSLTVAAWHDEEVWVHGDLLPGNLLVTDGRLSGVIDFGGLNVGDPACDLQPAWNLFDARGRERFRAELGADDASWLRGRGWALAQALIALPYYWNSNPGLVRQARSALQNVLSDRSS